MISFNLRKHCEDCVGSRASGGAWPDRFPADPFDAALGATGTCGGPIRRLPFRVVVGFVSAPALLRHLGYRNAVTKHCLHTPVVTHTLTMPAPLTVEIMDHSPD